MVISCGSGPAEHKGIAKICPYYILAPTYLYITLFQPVGADYVHLVILTMEDIKPFHLLYHKLSKMKS